MTDSQRPHPHEGTAEEENRTSTRFPVEIAVFCQVIQGEEQLYWSACLMDVSLTGMKLLSAHFFEPTTVIRIGHIGAAEDELLAAVVVRAHRSPEEKWTLGCALIKDLSEAELLAWIERNGRPCSLRQDSADGPVVVRPIS